MQLHCDTSCADQYKSLPQKARVISEAWFVSNGYCLACQNDRLQATVANTKATDFTCVACGHNYELKTFQARPKRSLVDGAYSTMMARIMDGTVPTLLMLERNNDWTITGLTAVHHTFLTPSVIAERKPLSQSARRAGWIGCNIRLDQIPADAQISIIEDGRSNESGLVRKTFQRYERLRTIEPKSRGWTTLTLLVIRSLRRTSFTLSDIYERQSQFAAAYPDNRNVLPKIRQQLQVLRDLGYLEFIGKGAYRLLI
jgi:type II restriction enzyme